jgi:alpha-glucosidase
MLDDENPSVLSYVRTAPSGAKPILVSVNMTAQPQTIHLNLDPAGIHAHHIKTLLADTASFNNLSGTTDITLPPYASLIAEIEP